MTNRIILGTTVDQIKLQDDSRYQRFLSVMERLGYRVELIEYDCQNNLCGVIDKRKLPKHQSIHEEQAWLPIITCSQLAKPDLLENYVVRILALAHLNQIRENNFAKSALLSFHTRYKLLLLAYSQPDYRKIGPFVANIDNWSLPDFFMQYRQLLMILLTNEASRKNHANVLQHIQGYFKPYLSNQQKQDLVNSIDMFRQGVLPLLPVIEQLKEYLNQFPNHYLSNQYYLTEYVNVLTACYSESK